LPANVSADVKFGSISFTPDGRHLVAGSGPKVTVWGWPGLKLARTIDLPKPSTIAVPNPPQGEYRCEVAEVSPDGKWLVTVAVRYWEKERDGQRYTYAADGVVDVWDFATGKRVRRLAEAQGSFRSGNFTADGRFLLVGAGGTIIEADGRAGEAFQAQLNLLDPVAGRLVRGFEVPPAPGSVSHRYSGASALSPDGRTLCVSYNTGEIVCFEVATGRPRRTLRGHRGFVGGLAFGADGNRLISGCHDGTALVWDVTLVGAAPVKPKPLMEADAEKLWGAAGGEDAKAAFAAMAELAASPEQAVVVLRRQVKPAPAAPTDAALDRLFADLGSVELATREKASAELNRLGGSAVPGVRKRLAENPSAEVRRRAGEFLKAFDSATPSPARLRELRAVELLEGLRTPEARKLLAELAAGAAGAPMTLDAAAALARLRGR
jgi:hypothetical protein